MSSEQEAPPFTMVRDAYVTAWDSVVDVADIPEVHAQARAEFDRFIAKVRAESYNAGFDDGFNANPDHEQVKKIEADAWDEGYETGCSSPYGTATPSGKPHDPEPNPYRKQGEA